MDGRRLVALLGAMALVAPPTGGTMPADASVRSASPTAAVPASMCFPSTDNGDPVLTSFTFSPSEVDSRRGAQTMTFTATAEDSGGPGAPSGLAEGTAFIGDDATSSSSNWRHAVPLKPDGHGALVGTLTILPQFLTATRYVALSIADVDGNNTLYTTDDLAQLGLPTTFTTTTRPDVNPPVVTSVRLSDTTIDTRRRSQGLRIRVHATDESAVTDIRVWLWGSPIRSSEEHLRLVSGTAADGVWQAVIQVPRWQGNSTAKLAMELTDVVSGFAFYGPKKLAAIRQPGTVRVLSRKDPAPPALRLRSVTPTQIDLRNGPQSVTVVVRVKDAGSGARTGAVNLDGPENGTGVESSSTPLERVSGTGRDGLWKGTLTLQPCDAVSGQWQATLFAWDAAAGNYISAPKAFTVVNNDVRRPTAAVVPDYYQVRRAGPLTIEFTEDVVGIDADNALVHVGDSQRGRAGANPPAISGSWTCRDATGASADCTRGPVRTAQFIPAAPMLAGTNHTLVLNPEQHLGLTDLAGNPYAPTAPVSFHTA